MPPRPPWLGRSGIAGAIFYSHMRQLAAAHGDTGWHAHAFPLSVDGVEIVASLVLFADRRAGRKSGWLPWAALTIGTAASLAANIATAHAGAISRIIAGWPAVALLIAVKLQGERHGCSTAASWHPASSACPFRHSRNRCANSDRADRRARARRGRPDGGGACSRGQVAPGRATLTRGRPRSPDARRRPPGALLPAHPAPARPPCRPGRPDP